MCKQGVAHCPWTVLLVIATFFLVWYSVYPTKFQRLLIAEETHRAVVDARPTVSVSESDLELTTLKYHPMPTIVYVITPTHNRTSQVPDLIRLAQTLMLASDVHWIVIEDSKVKTDFVINLLARMPFPNTHLNKETLKFERENKLRGQSQRNEGLKWLLAKNISTGVIYFADDDNTFDCRVFDELRTTTRVGIIPSGNFDETGISSPIVKSGKVTGFIAKFKASRKWLVDFADFGVNIAFWRSRGAPLCNAKTLGYIETKFLEAMHIQYSDFEPKANNCTEILVWHTKTRNIVLTPNKLNDYYANTNIPALVSNTPYEMVLRKSLSKIVAHSNNTNTTKIKTKKYISHH